jgi:hypothetical protein
MTQKGIALAIRAKHSKLGVFSLVLLGVASIVSMCDCDGEGGQYW